MATYFVADTRVGVKMSLNDEEQRPQLIIVFHEFKPSCSASARLPKDVTSETCPRLSGMLWGDAWWRRANEELLQFIFCWCGGEGEKKCIAFPYPLATRKRPRTRCLFQKWCPLGSFLNSGACIDDHFRRVGSKQSHYQRKAFHDFHSTITP